MSQPPVVPGAHDRHPDVVALVLAAGRGMRFGRGVKPAAELDGRPLVAHAVDAAVAGGVDHVVVVAGFGAPVVERILAETHPSVTVVRNRRWRDGQAYSLRAGVEVAERDPTVQAVLVLLADEPRVPAAAVAAVAATDADLARARYDDAPGHPVRLGRGVWPAAHRLEGDEGARSLLAAGTVVEVPVPGPRPADVDTPADLTRLGGGR